VSLPTALPQLTRPRSSAPDLAHPLQLQPQPQLAGQPPAHQPTRSEPAEAQHLVVPSVSRACTENARWWMLRKDAGAKVCLWHIESPRTPRSAARERSNAAGLADGATSRRRGLAARVRAAGSRPRPWHAGPHTQDWRSRHGRGDANAKFRLAASTPRSSATPPPPRRRVEPARVKTGTPTRPRGCDPVLARSSPGSIRLPPLRTGLRRRFDPPRHRRGSGTRRPPGIARGADPGRHPVPGAVGPLAGTRYRGRSDP
jgi:hypothetical protein